MKIRNVELTPRARRSIFHAMGGRSSKTDHAGGATGPGERWAGVEAARPRFPWLSACVLIGLVGLCGVLGGIAYERDRDRRVDLEIEFAQRVQAAMREVVKKHVELIESGDDPRYQLRPGVEPRPFTP